MQSIFKILLTCALIVLISSPRAAGYEKRDLLQQTATKAQLKQALILNQQWVPYPAYADRNGWDHFLGDNKDILIKDGEKYIDYTWQVVTATDYLEFTRSGDRNIMQDPNDSNNNALAALFLAELAEGRGRFVDQIINGVFYFSEMTAWALSAHLSLQANSKTFPDNIKPVIDLAAGTLGSMLSWIYYYLKPEFDKANPAIAQRLRYELQRRILDSYMDQHAVWWMARNSNENTFVNNWNPWCNFNVLQCYMLLENDLDRLTDAVYTSMVSVDAFINYTHADGACEEGPSYWGHAAGKMYDYLQMLFQATGGKVSIFHETIIKNMGEYIVRSYVGNGWVVNFADASARGGGDTDMIYRYGKAVQSDLMTHYAAYQWQLTQNTVRHASNDIFRTFQNFKYLPELTQARASFSQPTYTWYPNTEFCYMTTPGGWFMAAKGGYNDESHNHNDAGSFSLYLNGSPLFIDAGVGTYTRQTFSGERYSIWTMQSNYHSLPLINGVPEKNGKQYKATDVLFDAKRMTFSANIATAYPKEANVKQWNRSYTLKNETLTIRDRFELEQASAPNVINFLTWGQVDISAAGIVNIKVEGEDIVLTYDAKTFKPSLESIPLDDASLCRVWGKEIFRLSLTATSTPLKGTYTYTVRQKSKTHTFAQEAVTMAAKQLNRQVISIQNTDKVLNPVTVTKQGSIYYCNPSDWRSGFFPGTLWYLYELTGDKTYLPMATSLTESLYEARNLTSHHDIGFIIGSSYGNYYRLTGEASCKDVIIQAAKSLCTRFRPQAGIIQSWEARKKEGWACPVIIDNMMNLELLFEASLLTQDSTYYKIAVSHADRTLKEHFRSNGSCYHVVDYDLTTGEIHVRQTSQGYAHESAWSRGQAWAIYGFTMAYRYTRDQRYLDQAIKTFNFMKNHPNMAHDLIPYWDMDCPDIPNTPRDASSAAIIASALFEMAQYDTAHAAAYRDYAGRILKSLNSPEYRAAIGTNGNFLIKHCVGSIPHNAEVDKPLNYADYYYLEALKRINP